VRQQLVFLFSLRRLEDDAIANFLLAADLRVILVPVLAAKMKQIPLIIHVRDDDTLSIDSK
jgi:hypothetical protein